MRKSIKGILIDPFSKTVTEVTVTGEPSSWGSDYDYLESFYNFLDCTVVQPATLDIVGESLYVDEEGLIREKRQMFFYLPNISPYQPLAGKGIFVGFSDDGKYKDTALTVEDIQKQIEWMSPIQALAKSKQIEASL